MRLATALSVLALPAWAGERASIVFEGGGERMEVPAASLADMALTEREQGLAEVYFALSPEDAGRFEDMTGRLVGEQMRVSACGILLAEPNVLMPIEGGRIVVTGGMDYMADLFAALKVAGECPEGGA